jgi:hypothetical protein
MRKEWNQLIDQSSVLGVEIVAGTDPWGDDNWGWWFALPDSNERHFVMDLRAEYGCADNVTVFDPSDEEIEDLRNFLQSISR